MSASSAPTGRRVEGQRGQPATLVQINPKGAFGIGVRLDRDAIETALVDLGGEILDRRVHNRILPPPLQTLELVRADIAALLAAMQPAERVRIAGIGVAQPYKLGTCLRGVTGNAGDIAVMPVRPGTLPSAPKPAGKWEMLLSRASLNALARHLRWCGEEVRTHTDLEDFVRAGHPAVDEWLADCIDALAPALRAALCMLDVPVVVIDADVDAGLVERLMQALARELADTAPEARGVPAIVRGSFGTEAGAIGAASLPMFFSFSPRSEVLRGGTRNAEETEHA